MIVILIHILLIYVGTLFTYKSMVKAGVDSKKALIPFVNTMEWVRVIGRPKYQAFVVYLPICNFFLLFSFYTDFSRCFGRTSFGDYFKAMVVPYIHFTQLGNNGKYFGTIDKMVAENKGIIREWCDSIVFALLAAALIRWSTFEAFTIPTQSMEGTMLVGDYLFVSKLHYGPRSPITPLQVPLTHQTIWFTDSKGDGTTGIKSYLDWVQLPYFRFPGLTTIKRNDIIVFNWPWDNGKDTYVDFGTLGKADLRPTDLKMNYVKRCVAMPGDTLEVRKENIIINGKISEFKAVVQHKYVFYVDSSKFSRAFNLNNNFNNWPAYVDELRMKFVQDYGLYIGDVSYELEMQQNGNPVINPNFPIHFLAATTEEKAMKIGKNPLIKKVQKNYSPKGDISQTGPLYPVEMEWSVDEYGPLVIPKKGATMQVNKRNLLMFERALCYFEGEKIEIKDDYNKLVVNGKEVSEYTFKQNYYYMIGDNRHSSYDSRTWGFVPEDHIVGTPLLIFFSLENHPTKTFLERIRWNRLFNFVR